MLSRAEEQYIQNQLELFHCTNREVEIYLQTLKSGPSSVQAIANQLGQNRITIHSAVTRLIQKGLLYESRKGKRRLIIAEEPDTLHRLLKIKEGELESARANLGYVIGLLRSVHNPDTDRPDIQFYEGVDGFKRMLEMTLSAKNEFFGLINIEIFSQLLSPDYLKSFFERRAKNGIRSRLIWPKEDAFAKQILKDATEYKLQARYLRSHKEWSSGFISWDNYISLKSFSAGQITCTIIKNADIVSFYRDIVFEVLWGTAEVIR